MKYMAADFLHRFPQVTCAQEASRHHFGADMANELVTIDGYCKVTKTSLEFKRDVSKDEWQKVFDACRHVEGCIQFWIGDLLKYREQKWGMYDDIAEKTGIEKETLRQYKQVSENIESGLRNPNLGFHHHKAVSSLSPEKQKIFLDMAEKENMPVYELRNEIRKSKIIDNGQISLPDKKYDIIYADPPWAYQEKNIDGYGAATQHYKTMSIQEICDLNILALAKENCALFLWTTSPHLENSFLVIKSWGFEFKSTFVWDKIKHNMGFYNSVRHEFLMICTKGSMTPWNKKLYDSVQSIERKEHSEKPDEFREIINTLYPNSKKIELFARKKITGWDTWGNQI